MSLIPTLIERIARARTDLRLGLPVVLRDGEIRVLVLAAEGMHRHPSRPPARLGTPILAITARRADNAARPGL